MTSRAPLPTSLRAVPLLAALFFAPAALAHPGDLPADFVDQLVAGPLDRPVGIAFLPDGRLLVVELRTARIRMIVNGAIAATDPVGTVDSVRAPGGGVNSDDEYGLLGIEVDRDWPARPYVYVMYDATSGFVRISRLTATGDLSNPTSGNLSIDPASRHDILRDIPDVNLNHNGGTMRFGPDGMLYAALAEDANACTAQDTTTLRGVLVRMDVSGLPDGPGIANKAALVPADNPYAMHPNVNTRLMWARGLRNPFRFDIDAVTGDIFIADVGFDSREEIDLVDGPNLNFGWPYYEGTTPQFLTGCPVPIPPVLRDPIYEYDRSCVIGGVVHRPVACTNCNFPAEYDGDYFFSDYYDGRLQRLKNNAGTWGIAPAVPGQPTPSNWGENFDFVTDWATGPDGAMWYCRLVESGARLANTGEIRRIVYQNPTGAVPGVVPAGVTFAAPAPSPARVEALLSFTLERPGRVTLAIYDAGGRRARTLIAGGERPAGQHSVRWDTHDEAGRPVAPGVYVARLAVEGVAIDRKLPVVR